jgi:hypothetical protein
MTVIRHAGGRLVLAASLALAGCGGGASGWVKPGGEAGDAARAYQECRDLAADAVRTDIDIDQDIAASRASDVQRSAVMQEQAWITRQHTQDRGAAIVAACMRAKGFAPAGG